MFDRAYLLANRVPRSSPNDERGATGAPRRRAGPSRDRRRTVLYSPRRPGGAGARDAAADQSSNFKPTVSGTEEAELKPSSRSGDTLAS